MEKQGTFSPDNQALQRVHFLQFFLSHPLHFHCVTQAPHLLTARVPTFLYSMIHLEIADSSETLLPIEGNSHASSHPWLEHKPAMAANVSDCLGFEENFQGLPKSANSAECRIWRHARNNHRFVPELKRWKVSPKQEIVAMFKTNQPAPEKMTIGAPGFAQQPRHLMIWSLICSDPNKYRYTLYNTSALPLVDEKGGKFLPT